MHIKGQFAERLVSLLKKNSYLSTRAPEGVSVKQLVATIGCTRAMARRYVNGTALPDHATLIHIARWLDVPPGWLLFGDKQIPEHIGHSTQHVIVISQDLLEYVLLSANHYISQYQPNRLFGSFLLTLINDVIAMKTDIQTSKQAIDLAFKGLRAQHQEEPYHSTS